jgi:hypothetical protein
MWWMLLGRPFIDSEEYLTIVSKVNHQSRKDGYYGWNRCEELTVKDGLTTETSGSDEAELITEEPVQWPVCLNCQ